MLSPSGSGIDLSAFGGDLMVTGQATIANAATVGFLSVKPAESKLGDGNVRFEKLSVTGTGAGYPGIDISNTPEGYLCLRYPRYRRQQLARHAAR